MVKRARIPNREVVARQVREWGRAEVAADLAGWAEYPGGSHSALP
jgi:hypothetical protein